MASSAVYPPGETGTVKSIFFDALTTSYTSDQVMKWRGRLVILAETNDLA